MRITIPRGAQFILDQLHDNSYEAYVVGGCVRDSLMGKEPHDWDICTSATPDDVKRIFDDRRIIETGLKHGTVTIYSDDTFYEVTTYRAESTYSDHRRPDEVKFVTSLYEDLSRRDFTVNAIAYDTELVDPFDGQADLINHKIRCVGNPCDRFNEDALRMLRAIRFATRFGFAIEKDTDYAIKQNYKLLHHISIERINTEFSQIIMNIDTQMMFKYDYLWTYLIPELEIYKEKKIWQLIVSQVGRAKHDLIVRLTILCTYLGAKRTEEILTRMRYDNHTIKTVVKLTHHSGFRIDEDDIAIRRLLNILSIDEFRNLIDIRKAYNNTIAANQRLDRILSRAHVLAETDCFTLKKLAINGNDLKALGLKNEKIGSTLTKLLSVVIEDQTRNTKDTLLEIAKNMIN